MTHQSHPKIERVTVGVDFSESSLRAARWAAQHFARGAELILVHVINIPVVPLSSGDRAAQRERVIETARAGAEVRLRALSDSFATGLVWLEVRVGKPDEEIVRVVMEYRADLVLLGRQGGRAGVWGFVGTTAQRVVRRSTTPVLLMGDQSLAEPEGDASRLLVAVDDSDMTTAVLHWGRYLAARFSGEATVLHALDVRNYSSIAASAGSPAWAELYTPRFGPPTAGADVRDAERWLSDRLRGVVGGEHMTPIVVARPRTPAELIIAEAEIRRANLIVLGSRGANATSRLLFGSVAERVLLGASCPVFVVQTGQGILANSRPVSPSRRRESVRRVRARCRQRSREAYAKARAP